VTDPTHLFDGPGEEAPRLCSYLRAKVTRGTHNDKAALYAMRNDATSIFWCLLTMSPAGPDDGLAHADRCGPERICCEEEKTAV
jgi:hypothetical protein